MTHQYNNQLINETSPYLLQHAHNPVNWYPYGDEALQKAQQENKLILFSIGYAACHWCHVMEHESFEDESVAEIMNEHFVCIKIDREERPDLDQIYMDAVRLLTGSGGWPLNCFALPDGRPVFGGTYFRVQDWKRVLGSLAQGYHINPQKFLRAAQELTQGIQQTELVEPQNNQKKVSQEAIDKSIETIVRYFDYKHGGLLGAPKFPMPGIYETLLDYALIYNKPDILNHIEQTLKKWAYSGLYDILGGGFSRYSVDKEWLVPHFEKMLYDNGQLLSLYAKMYRQTKTPVFKRIIEETTQWLERDMLDASGLFYASYDADSEGEEGKFYLWDISEVESVLGQDSQTFIEHYGISKEGNFEGRNILTVPTLEEPNALIQQQKEQLFKHREQRIKPGLDNKMLTSWNALTISGLCQSYLATQDCKYLLLAMNAGNAIIKHHITSEGTLLRLAKKKDSVEGFLDDYGFTIKAFLDLYETSLEDKWLEYAISLWQKAEDTFFDAKSGMYFYSSAKNQLIARKMELTDNVIPASNAVMCENLRRLAIYTGQTELTEKAEQMILNTQHITASSPMYAYLWIEQQIKQQNPNKELVIVGKNAVVSLLKTQKDYHPLLMVSGTSTPKEDSHLFKGRWQDKETLFYLCVDNTCEKPCKDIEDILIKKTE